MQMRGLAAASGLPAATIKFYQREGLLPPGDRLGPNRAEYGEQHVRRLALIRALREVGGLDIATIRRVIEAAAGPGSGTVAGMAVAMDALASREVDRTGLGEDPEVASTAADAADLLRGLGWTVREEAGALRMLAAGLVAAARAHGCAPATGSVLLYAPAIAEIARQEITMGAAPVTSGGESAITWAAAGTVLSEPVILALRRLAHEHFVLTGAAAGRPGG